MKKIPLVLIISALATLALDQITKYFAAQYITGPIALAGNFIKLVLLKNKGIAFSIDLPLSLIILLTYIFFVIGIYYAYQDLDLNKKKATILLGVVIGGAVGNLLDRMFRGAVIDFLAIGSYPVINLADIAISLGLVGLIAGYNHWKKRGPKLKD